jgi:hypothetical protein
MQWIKQVAEPSWPCEWLCYSKFDDAIAGRQQWGLLPSCLGEVPRGMLVAIIASITH